MRELRTHENEKFERFFSYVRNAAKKEGCMFFVYSWDGHEYESENMEGEDLFGWLIPEDMVQSFESDFKQDKVSSEWDQYLCFANWEKLGNNELLIHFE